MNERAIVAGMLSGRLALRDVLPLTLESFSDDNLGRCFWALKTLLRYGFSPKTSRILVGFDVMGWPPGGVVELIAELRAEG